MVQTVRFFHNQTIVLVEQKAHAYMYKAVIISSSYRFFRSRIFAFIDSRNNTPVFQNTLA